MPLIFLRTRQRSFQQVYLSSTMHQATRSEPLMLFQLATYPNFQGRARHIIRMDTECSRQFCPMDVFRTSILRRYPGYFKGMQVILQEGGLWLEERTPLAQYKGFKYEPGEPNCCCCCLLFTQPDFYQSEVTPGSVYYFKRPYLNGKHVLYMRCPAESLCK